MNQEDAASPWVIVIAALMLMAGSVLAVPRVRNMILEYLQALQGVVVCRFGKSDRTINDF